jgi:hypothetical protein
MGRAEARAMSALPGTVREERALGARADRLAQDVLNADPERQDARRAGLRALADVDHGAWPSRPRR